MANTDKVDSLIYQGGLMGRIRRYRIFLLCSLCVLLVLPVCALHAAKPSAVAFSAATYQKGPQGTEKLGKIFVQGSFVRTEINAADRDVKIFDTDKGVSYQLYPDRRQYLEMPYVSTLFQKNPADGEINPCAGMSGAQCERLGVTTISGRDAVEWNITVTQDKKTIRIRQWIDSQRGFVLRHVTDQGEYSELQLLGRVKLGNRDVEKWEMSVSDGEQPPQHTLSWFDPELNLAIKEEFPGGYVRELRNVRIDPQDPRLFVIPGDYQKISVRQAPAGE
jgi:hypothetical protein